MWRRGTEEENDIWKSNSTYCTILREKLSNPHTFLKKVLVKSRNGRKCITKEGENENL